MFGWSRRHPTGDPSPGPIKRGMGCAANQWGGGGRGTKAHCEINADGSVVMRCGTQDIGVGTRTHRDDGDGRDARHPDGRGEGRDRRQQLPVQRRLAAAARRRASVAPAIRVTAGQGARRAVGARGADDWRRAGDRSSPSTAASSRRTTPSKGLAWKDACRLLGTEPVSVDGEWEAGLSASGTSGVQFAEVEVDIETGVTRVTRIVCVQDCGLILDPLTAESQCIGGIISGRELRAVREPHPRSQHRASW